MTTQRLTENGNYDDAVTNWERGQLPKDELRAEVIRLFASGEDVNHTVFCVDYKCNAGQVCDIIREELEKRDPILWTPIAANSFVAGNSLPAYGQWVHVVIGGVVQRVAYRLHAIPYSWEPAIDDADWVPFEAVSHWRPLLLPPTK